MNSPELARKWTTFLGARKDIPHSKDLLEHFNAGTITRICECGCNSYDLKVTKEDGLTPLMPARERGGCVLSLAFHTDDGSGSLEFDVFVDAKGYLAGIDVSRNGNSERVTPESIVIEPPFHIYGPLLEIAEQDS